MDFQLSKKLAETLFILNYHGENILNAVCAMKHIIEPGLHESWLDSLDGNKPVTTTTPSGALQPPRAETPRLFADETYQLLIKTVVKRFPEVVDVTKVRAVYT